MTEEELILSKHIKMLAMHADNYEYIFIDATNKEKKIPNTLLEAYLKIVYEINERKQKLKTLQNETLFKQKQ